jgi:5-methylcytosine-specific restriction enzyme subunit McrC
VNFQFPQRVKIEFPLTLSNLFRMLEYAYRIQEIKFLKGLVDCRSLSEFYENLAHFLALRILDRARKGLYREYVHRSEQLPFLRGRLDVPRLVRTPWEVRPECHFHEHTADIEANQILAWTLSVIVRSGMCTERVLPSVRQAFRTMQGASRLVPKAAENCTNVLYNRLSEDYRPLHALCRFFLEQAGPTHLSGGHETLPFLVDMAKLFERFVASWLASHLPDNWALKVQHRTYLDPECKLAFVMDLVLCDAASGDPLCVIDTKYKAHSSPSADDIAQVIAYAEASGCPEAALVYPSRVREGQIYKGKTIRVRALSFDVGESIEDSGKAFLNSLLQ